MWITRREGGSWLPSPLDEAEINGGEDLTPIEFYLPMYIEPKHDTGWHNAPRHKKQKANEKAIRAEVIRRARTRLRLCPVRVDTLFWKKWPKRTPKYKLGLAWEPCDSTPDVGNQRKQLLDAFQGIYYVNDKQVCAGIELKTWGPEDGVFVRISELTAEDARAFWKSNMGAKGD